MSVPILSARSIVKSFAGRAWFGGAGNAKRAVDDVDLDVNEGETLAIVGEIRLGQEHACPHPAGSHQAELGRCGL